MKRKYKIVKIKSNIGNVGLLNIVTKCDAFLYNSYDHKKALEEYRELYKEKLNIFSENPNCHDMPDVLKDKYQVQKIGKLREIHFSPTGKAWRFKIGNKYAKSFFCEDFGVSIFPVKYLK